MLPKLDAGNAPVISASSALRQTAVVADPRQEGVARLEQIALGRTLQAQVLTSLGDGSSLVRLASEGAAARPFELRMQLPPALVAGEQFALTLLALEPRPTFGLQASGGSVQTQLSAAAQLIGQLLAQAENGQQPRALQGSAPLQTAPGADPAHLSQNLKQALEDSGLFYESHLDQWSRGERTLDQIRQEPQNRVAGDAAAAQLLPLQLDTLEQRRLVWQGELWPGQPLQWEVLREKEQDQGGKPAGREDPQAAAWQTVLRLELPQLGLVSASIRLQGGQAQLQLRTADADAATALKAGQSGLDEALTAAGTALGGFLVQSYEPSA